MLNLIDHKDREKDLRTMSNYLMNQMSFTMEIS